MAKQKKHKRREDPMAFGLCFKRSCQQKGIHTPMRFKVFPNHVLINADIHPTITVTNREDFKREYHIASITANTDNDY